MATTVHPRRSFDEDFLIIPRGLTYGRKLSALTVAITVMLYDTDGPLPIDYIAKRFDATEDEAHAALTAAAAEGFIQQLSADASPEELADHRGFTVMDTEAGPLTLFGWK